LGQITATLGRTIREFIRQKSVLFWTVAWPILWVLIGCFSFTGNVPDVIVPHLRGSITISMIAFALMTAGMANLPGNIASDRERGLLSKLKSMPIDPWRDFVGRFLGLLAFSSLALISIALVGYICGARFSYTIIGAWQSIGFVFLIIFASSGIGMLIGTFIKHVHGAIMTGVGITVISAAISGVMAPYSSLPWILQQFARTFPISSANSSIIYLLAGEDYAGYNPLGIIQTSLTITMSIILFAVGMIVYSRLCWMKE